MKNIKLMLLLVLSSGFAIDGSNNTFKRKELARYLQQKYTIEQLMLDKSNTLNEQEVKVFLEEEIKPLCLQQARDRYEAHNGVMSNEEEFITNVNFTYSYFMKLLKDNVQFRECWLTHINNLQKLSEQIQNENISENEIYKEMETPTPCSLYIQYFAKEAFMKNPDQK